MARAVWKDQVIAESAATIVVEGNHYFPPESVDQSILRDSPHTSRCSWKGTARYKDVVVEDEVNPNAAWTYPDPSRAAHRIAGYYAFWNGVRVEA